MHENVRVTRRVVDAANRRDTEGFIACLSPDVDWQENSDLLGGVLRGLYRGPTEVREWFDEAFLDLWERFHIEAGEITELSFDRVLLETLLTARGPASGVETRLHVWNIFWFADGKVAKRQVFRTRDEALAAAGLSEQEGE